MPLSAALLGGLLVVAVALAAVVGGVVLLQSRDDADVGGGGGPGEKVAARCPDAPAGVTRDARRLSEDQIRQALSLGNVVLRYRGARPPAPLRELQDELTGPFDAEIAAAGQAVVLARGGRGRRGAGLGPAAARAHARRPAAAGVRRGVARRGRAGALPLLTAFAPMPGRVAPLRIALAQIDARVGDIERQRGAGCARARRRPARRAPSWSCSPSSR